MSLSSGGGNEVCRSLRDGPRRNLDSSGAPWVLALCGAAAQQLCLGGKACTAVCSSHGAGGKSGSFLCIGRRNQKNLPRTLGRNLLWRARALGARRKNNAGVVQ